ncbi:MAG: DUF4838 domain-containing protein [Candidatus Bathyarchaeia archaeon]
MKDEIIIVLEGEAKAIIVAPKEGPLAYAASQLQLYIERISGARLAILSEERTEERTRIVLRLREGVAKHDGYVLRAEGDRVMIEASEPRGCIYGAYGLLEELGCRFYGPEPLGIILPRRKTLKLPSNLKILREPAFVNRIPSGGSHEEQVRWGFNFIGIRPTPEHEELARKLGVKRYSWGHIWPRLISMQYFADGRHPEKMDYEGREDWLPVDEYGVRRYNPASYRPWDGGQSLCFSNREAFEWFTDNAVNWILSECRNADYISLWSADTRELALCRCPRCRSQYSTSGYMYPTDWYLHVHNAIRRKLNERGWRGSFGWIAYHGTESPPVYVNLHEEGRNMDFLYAPRPRGGGQYGPFTNDHPINIRYRQNLEGWLSYLKAQGYKGSKTVFEYYFDLVLLGNLAAGRAFLIPKHETMQEDLKYYHQQGFDGFFDCNPPSNTYFPDPLSWWLYTRLLWDINLDLKAAREDFFINYYGPVADDVRRVREAVEDLMFQGPSQEIIDELRSLKARCEAILSKVVNDDALAKRVEGMRLWVHYCALCKESEFHEKVTMDKEKGKAVEREIRKWLNDNKEFLVSHRFMSAQDLAYIAGPVVERHLRLFELL